MSATCDPGTIPYACVICGWVFRFRHDNGFVTWHRNVPHPYDIHQDEEDNPQ
jgi:hypothetical protein